MKLLIIAILAMMPGSLYSADNFGQKIEFYSTDGIPAFGVQYAYDETFLWAFTFTVSGTDLPGGKPLKSFAWRLWDSKSQRYLTEWMNENPVLEAPASTIPFSLGLTKKSEIANVIRALPSLVVLISVNEETKNDRSTYHIDLGSFCVSSPGHFRNLSTGALGCVAQLPEADGMSLCGPQDHKIYCVDSYADVRDIIGKQKGCVFKCSGENRR